MKNQAIFPIVLTGLLLTGAACSSKTVTTTNATTNTVVNTSVNDNLVTESGCPQEGHIKSPSSFDAAKITFDNQTAGAVKIYWLDFNGARKYYRDLAAKSSYTQDTWIGHVWVVANGTDQCVKLESANAVEQTLVID